MNKYAEIYKRAQLIKACNYILYLKHCQLYGPQAAGILMEKRANAFWNGAKFVGGTALSFLFPVMGAVGGASAGYKIGDWAANAMGWQPEGFGANALRYLGAVAGGTGGWFLGRGFNQIGRTAGSFAKGLLGIKGNNSRVANFLFGGAGTTLGMGGLTGMYAAGKPQEWLEGAGTMAENASHGLNFTRKSNAMMDKQLANMNSNQRTNFTSKAFQSVGGDSTSPSAIS